MSNLQRRVMNSFDRIELMMKRISLDENQINELLLFIDEEKNLVLEVMSERIEEQEC